MADRKRAWASVSAPTFTLASLAASSTLVAGRESDTVDNTTTKYLDFQYTQRTKVGTTLTAGFIELWVVPSFDGGTTWPDVFDGTDSNETITSRDILGAAARCGAVVATSTTNSLTYDLAIPSIARLFDGQVPEKFVFFVVQSTNAALSATGGDHVGYLRGAYETIA